MKKLFLIFLCTISVNLFAFASPDGVFFGFNSWTHEELDDVGKIRTSSTTRILYDNCRYYVMPKKDMLHLCVNQMRIYTMNQIDLKKTGQKLEVHTVEDVNFESWFTFENEGKNFFITIEGDLGGVIDSFETEQTASKIKISYKIRRPIRDEFGEASGKYYEIESCSDTFFNTSRSVLNEAIVYTFNFALDNPEYCFTELNEDLISQILKPELRILRNLIYARHGYIFKSKDLRDLFTHFLRNYNPSISDQNDIELSEKEKELIRLIQKYENRN